MITHQHDLPYGGHPPHVEAETSEAAAASVANGAGSMRARVLCAIRECEDFGATDEELERCLCMLANTVRPRRRELFLMNQIQDSGIRRKTRSGRSAIVWKASTEAAP